MFFFFQAEDGIRAFHVTGVQTCALPIWPAADRLAGVARTRIGAYGGRARRGGFPASGVRRTTAHRRNEVCRTPYRQASADLGERGGRHLRPDAPSEWELLSRPGRPQRRQSLRVRDIRAAPGFLRVD